MGKKILSLLLGCFVATCFFSLPTYAGDVSGNPNFYSALYDVVSTDRNILGTQGGGVRDFLQKITTGELGAEGISDLIVNLIINFIIPLLVLAGIVLAIVGFFKLMASDKEEDLKTGWNYILRGVVGALIMVSAAWIVIQLVGADGAGGIVGTIVNGDNRPSGAQVASDLYRQIAYPLIRVVLNIIIGIMFLIAVAQGFKYLFSGNDEIQKKALAILLYTTVGILIVILAKTLVEVTYGKYEDVVNVEVRPGGQDLGQVGDGVFENPQLDTLYVVLNWILGLATFIVTILIVYIGYLLLIQPTSEENTTKLKKTISRALAGILLIGVAYLIANFVIIT